MSRHSLVLDERVERLETLGGIGVDFLDYPGEVNSGQGGIPRVLQGTSLMRNEPSPSVKPVIHSEGKGGAFPMLEIV